MTISARLISVVPALIALGFNGPAVAQPYPGSLWIGTDNVTTLSVRNTDRNGVVLRTFGPLECTGIAIDVAANIIYMGTSSGSITTRDLTTLASGASISVLGTEDMAFDGTYIWRAGATGPQPSSTIRRIDPVAQTSVAVFTIPYVSLGIAWDGSGLWISEFTTNGIIARYDTLGNPTGESFHTAEGFQNGGLAFDTSDGTLFMGSWGRIYHYTTTGAVLGYFDPYGGFIDGLEFEPEQPVGIGPSWPAAERLSLSVRPNPSSAPFEIAVNAGGPVQFRILDISGRVVKEMTMPANEGDRVVWQWDGRGQNGLLSPRGAYFVRVESAGFEAARKLILQR